MQMASAKQGDTVHVHYTGKLPDGTVFDSSAQRGPFEFTIGEGQVIPGFEEAVEGMEVGGAQTAQIPAEEAYGPRREELLLRISENQMAPGLKPELGQPMELSTRDGQTLQAVVSEINDDHLILDANHPLAGKDLIFELELVAIK